jgi:tetratricopeptide (TPR) repeat protein
MKRRLQKYEWPARRRIVAVLALLLGLTSVVWAQKKTDDEAPTAKLQQMFLEASHAYDANRPAEAAAIYGKLVDQGYESKELFFNLGNAYFKSGKIGQAVLHYRRAWYLAPRDPDIQANLRFALQSTSASPPDYSTPARLLFKLSTSEWIALATFSYWVSAAVLVLFLAMRNQRVALARALSALLGLLILSAAGIVNGAIARRAPEFVVIEPSQQALYAPLEGSKAFFALPEGSIVRLKEQSGSWYKVTTGRQSGYLPSNACVPVGIR